MFLSNFILLQDYSVFTRLKVKLIQTDPAQAVSQNKSSDSKLSRLLCVTVVVLEHITSLFFQLGCKGLPTIDAGDLI